MKAIVALIAAQAAGTATPAPIPASTPAPAPMPAMDWSRLPELALHRPPAVGAQISAYVRDEVQAGHCDAAAGARRLRVQMAVLMGEGRVRRIVPRAIGCPTVEQYASGIASRLMRGNVVPGGAGGWFRTTLDFAW